jgi:hypothetical protein
VPPSSGAVFLLKDTTMTTTTTMPFFEQLHDLCGGRVGRCDVSCMFCGPSRKTPSNRSRRVLRIWNDGDGFITFHCERCGESGYSREEGTGRRPAPRPRREPVKNQEPEKDKSEIARFLWDRSLPAPGTIVETYLRSRSCWVESSSIRFLPARDDYEPAMISRFGIDGTVTGIHLTRLKPDGSGKAGTDKDKIMLGASIGQPIVVLDNPDHGDLVVTEGIEDALSFATSTGWAAWAAGSAGRISKTVSASTGFDHVFVAVDDDFAGRRALALAKEAEPDVIPIIFTDHDANAIKINHGPDKILSVIDAAWSASRSAPSLRKAA